MDRCSTGRSPSSAPAPHDMSGRYALNPYATLHATLAKNHPLPGPRATPTLCKMGIPTAANYVARPPWSASNRAGGGGGPEGQPSMGTGSGQCHGWLERDGTVRIAGPAAQAEGLVSQAQQCSLVSSSGPGGRGGSPGTSLGLPKPSWLGPSRESLGAANSGLQAPVSRQLPPPLPAQALSSTPEGSEEGEAGSLG